MSAEPSTRRSPPTGQSLPDRLGDARRAPGSPSCALPCPQPRSRYGPDEPLELDPPDFFPPACSRSPEEGPRSWRPLASGPSSGCGCLQTRDPSKWPGKRRRGKREKGRAEKKGIGKVRREEGKRKQEEDRGEEVGGGRRGGRMKVEKEGREEKGSERRIKRRKDESRKGGRGGRESEEQGEAERVKRENGRKRRGG